MEVEPVSRFHYLLCAIPIAVIAVAALLGYEGPVLALAILACPIMMIFMMVGMHRHKGSHDHNPADSDRRADQQVRRGR